MLPSDTWKVSVWKPDQILSQDPRGLELGLMKKNFHSKIRKNLLTIKVKIEVADTELGSFTLCQANKPHGWFQGAPPNTQTAILPLCKDTCIVALPAGLRAAIEYARGLKAIAEHAPSGGDFAHTPISPWLAAAAAAAAGCLRNLREDSGVSRLWLGWALLPGAASLQAWGRGSAPGGSSSIPRWLGCILSLPLFRIASP